MADNSNMSDLGSIAQIVARIDERTLNMSSTMTRVETGLADHKNSTERRFDEMMEKHIEPMKEAIAKGRMWLGILSLGGGAGGALTAEKVLHLMGLK